MVELFTPRLVLRQWRAADLEPFAVLNADPEVMQYFPAPLSREQSDALADDAGSAISQRGWGLWAVEVSEARAFIGFVGLSVAKFEAHFTPAVEIGWRLARSHWGNGYATEGACAAIAFGFDELQLDEIVSFTSSVNDRSRRVMERLGMARDPAEDFEHPAVPDGRLRTHVLFRLPRNRVGKPELHHKVRFQPHVGEFSTLADHCWSPRLEVAMRGYQPERHVARTAPGRQRKADAVGEAMLIEKVRHAVSEDAWQEVARVAEMRFRLRRSLADGDADPQAPGSDDPFADAALSAGSGSAR